MRDASKAFCAIRKDSYGPTILRSIQSNGTVNPDLKIIIHLGVPGGGKTTLLQKLYNECEGSKIMLVKSREVLNQVKVDNKAILGNTISVKAKTVFVDEFVMSHPGDILRTLTESVEELVLVGDEMQLSYHCPIPHYDTMYDYGYFLRRAEVTRHNITYRCPISITTRLAQFYPNISTANRSAGQINIVRIRRLEDVPPCEFRLAFTKAEAQTIGCPTVA